MNIEDVRIAPLADKHIRSRFKNTHAGIQSYCRGRLRKENSAYLVRAFVACEGDSPEVLGFYCLHVSSVEIDAERRTSDEAQLAGMPAIPVIHMKMLGVNTPLARQGLGKRLVADAMERVKTIAENAGTWALTLNAMDEDAARYYQNNFAFQRFGDNGLRMFLTLGKIFDALL